MPDTTHDAARDLLAAYALDAITDEERLVVDTHVGECADCRATLDELMATRDLLASSVQHVEPPPRLRSSLLAAVAADAAETATAPAPSAPTAVTQPPAARSHRRWFDRAMPALAVAASIAAVALGITAIVQHNNANDLRAQVTASGGRSSMLDGAATMPVKLMEPAMAPQMHGQLVVKDGHGLLVLEGLPAAPEGKEWRAWSVTDDHAMTQHGVAGDGSRMTFIPVGDVAMDTPGSASNVAATKVMLTLEPASMPMTSTQPTGTPVAAVTV